LAEYSLLRRSGVFRRNSFEALHYTFPLIDNTRNKQKIAAAVGLGRFQMLFRRSAVFEACVLLAMAPELV